MNGVFGPPAGAPMRAAWAGLWGCVALALVLYLTTIDYAYFADDHVYLGFGTSKLITLPPAEFTRLFTERMNPWEYLPLRDLTYWLDIQLLGGFPDGFHFSNIVWYALACAAAAFCVAQFLRWISPERSSDDYRVLLTLIVAAFAVHPAHVEAVAWIAGRKDVLAGLFMLLAFGLFVRGLNGGYRYRDLILSCVALTAALLCKGAVVGSALLFPVLGVAARMPGQRRRTALYVLAPVIVAAGLTWLHTMIGAETGIRVQSHVDALVVLERASRIWTTLLGILVLPVRLRLVYDVYANSGLHWVVSGLGFMAFVAAVGALLRGRRSSSAVGVVIIVGSVLPYLQIVPFSTWSMASERFLFLAVVGAALILGDAIRIIRPKLHRLGGAALALCIAVVLVAGLVQTHARILQWETPRSLVESQYRYDPTYFSSVRLYVQTLHPSVLAYPDALQAIMGVEDPSARELLGRWLTVRNAFYANKMPSGLDQMSDSVPYCTLAPGLQRALPDQMRYAMSQRDLAYSSMLRGLHKEMTTTLPKVERICVKGPQT